MPTALARLTQPLMPPIRTLRNYRWSDLPADVIAGITVSVVDLPQSMAFAVIAGVSPVYGIYTAIIQAFLGGLFTSSRFLSNGPTNTQSLLVAAIVTRMADSHADPQRYLELVIALTLIKGIIQLAFAGARLGRLVRYVSNSVMVGFTAGAGVLIILEQVPNFLGLPRMESTSHYLPGVPGALQRMWPHLPQLNFTAMWIGIGVLVCVLGAKKLSRWIPGPLVAVVGAAILVWAFGWDHSDHSLRVVGALHGSLKGFHVPDISLGDAEALLGGALAMALLGMLESVSIAKAIAVRTGQRIDANQEFFGQGISNFIAGFFWCMPGSGSFSRSALQYSVGAKTRVASMFCAMFNLLIFLLLYKEARFIPFAALAAILFVVGATLIDWRNIQRIMRTSMSDATVCVITFAAALLLPLTYAIYVGIFLNLALYIREASRLHVTEMVAGRDRPFVERPLSDRTGGKSVLFLSLEGDLFFGVADELQDRFNEIAKSPVRVVICRLKRTHLIDATVFGVFEQFIKSMQQRDGQVLFCGVKPSLYRRMKNFGLIRMVGNENVFPTEPGIFSSAKAAIMRARQLIGSSIDTAGLDFEDDVVAAGPQTSQDSAML